ncbi:MAG: hypothetical protein ACRDNW_26735 [Trebonia sp.]
MIAIIARLMVGSLRRLRPRPHELGEDRAGIVALSEDLQHRIIDEQRGAIEPQEVLSWDSRAYRLARSRFRTRNQAAEIQAALHDLDEARAGLRMAWRFSKAEPGALPGEMENALQAHTAAIEQFADATAIFVRISWRDHRPNDTAA